MELCRKYDGSTETFHPWLDQIEEKLQQLKHAKKRSMQPVAYVSRDRSARLTHSELIRLNRFPTATAREIARAAEVYERALVIVRRHIESGHQFNLTRINTISKAIF